MTSFSSEVRRCRPLLGTFVEITATARSKGHACAAVEAAFGDIQRVQSLMSFHEPESDVSRLNRSAFQKTVEVSSWTYEVLLAAEKLHDESAGVFDLTIAPLLEKWGYLPKRSRGVSMHSHSANQSSIELLPDNRVRFHRPVRIDLGGIAKGFAVDKAIETLLEFGAASAVVNAGGDLRVFGSNPSTIHVRHPASPAQTLPLLQMSEGAFATSAGYYTRKKVRGRWVTPLVDPARCRSCAKPVSVSVQAPTAMIADALTKVVVVLGEQSAPLLKSYSATALLISQTGRVVVA
jgi:FAD:protein FMN transferase